MPAVIPIVAGILGAVTSGVSLAKELGGGGAPKISTAPTPAEIASNRSQLANVVRQGLGNQQEAGGGGLSPGYLASAIGNQSGTSNQMSLLLDLIKQYTGGGGGGGSSGFGGGTESTSLPNLSIPTQTTNTLNSGPGLADSSIFA